MTTKNPAIIVDLDSTLALKCDRNIYDEKRAIDDYVNQPIADLVNHFAKDHAIIIVTGRKSAHKDVSVEWLEKHSICYDLVLTREPMDVRCDAVIKKEIYDNQIKDKYDVKMVIDDRHRCCVMWHALGLLTLKIGDPESNY